MIEVDETSSAKRKPEEVLGSESPEKRPCTDDNIEENIKIKESNDQHAIKSSSLQEEKQECASEKDTCKEFPIECKVEEESKSAYEGKEIENNILELNPLDRNIDFSLINSNVTNTSIDQVTANNQLAPRQKCKYSSQCYRISADHKAKFSHPEDPDYNIPDNRPECPYGKDCYRKNPQHKLDYKHTRSKPKRSQTAMRSTSPQDLSDLEDSWDESVDESDYEPSFIDDDSIEEFESDFEE